MRQSLIAHVALFVNLPDVHVLLGFVRESGQELVVVTAESQRYPCLVVLDLCRAHNSSPLQHFIGCLTFLATRAVIINAVNRQDRHLVGFFSNSEVATVFTECHGCDAFRALNARVGPLYLVFQVVDDNVVTSRVHHLVVVKEKDVICDIRFESADKLRLKSNLGVLGDLRSASFGRAWVKIGFSSCLSRVCFYHSVR